jgi:hypothetical protein
MLLFNQLATCCLNNFVKEKRIQASTRLNFIQKSTVPSVVRAHDFGMLRTLFPLAQILDEAISQLMMLLCPLFGGHRFDSAAEELLIALASGLHKANK